MAIVRAKLASPAPLDVMFAMQLYEKAGAPGYAEVLIAGLDHTAAEVRRYALDQLRKQKSQAARPAIRAVRSPRRSATKA